MSDIYLTADTHFSQERTFKYSMRNMYFSSVEEMDRVMIENWNSTVKPEDTVLHLGDFGNWDIVQYLNGHIILLEGNYERDHKNGPLSEENKSKFQSIEKEKYLRLPVRKETVILVHEPHNIEEVPEEEKTDFYLFGHIHEKQKVKYNGLNVGVDVHNFAPVSWKTVEFYKEAITNVYDEDCFENFKLSKEKEQESKEEHKKDYPKEKRPKEVKYKAHEDVIEEYVNVEDVDGKLELLSNDELNDIRDKLDESFSHYLWDRDGEAGSNDMKNHIGRTKEKVALILLKRINELHERQGIELDEVYDVANFGWSPLQDTNYAQKEIMHFKNTETNVNCYFTGNDYRIYFPYQICGSKEEAQRVAKLMTDASHDPSPIHDIFPEAERREGLPDYYNDIVERHEIEDGRISKEGLGTTILDSSIPIRYREEKNGD